MLQPDLVAGEVAGGGREVVGGDRGQAPLAPLLGRRAGRRRRPRSNHRIDVPRMPRARRKSRASGGDHAEVLADDDGAGAVRLEGEDADQRGVVVADVGALVRPGGRSGSTRAGTAR